MKKRWGKVALALALVLAIGGIVVYSELQRNEPELHADVLEHFKYGSIGSEGRAGVPYRLWLVLPRVFEEHLPDGPGRGYERLGFLYEPGNRLRPIGTSFREEPIGQIGLNCAVCHTATIRDTATAPPRIVLGMPANQFHLQAYINFLRASARDERFTPDTLIAAIEREHPDFGGLEKLVYRHYVIPRTREALLQLQDDFDWMDRRPPQGPGRVDTFNPYKVLLGIDRKSDRDVGTVDLPSLWNQQVRRDMYLHWDGNNNDVDERNRSAAIGAGATPESLDLAAMKRVGDWIQELPPPRYPAQRIDDRLASDGAAVFAEQCSSCHGLDGRRVGQVTLVEQVGTDAERLSSFTPELAEKMNTIGTGQPWQFSHFRKTDGYANMPLDGLWLRAPYLHNGSVPNLRSLLSPRERPEVFFRDYDVYDHENMGFVTEGAEAERTGFAFDTRVPGNGNQGHVYGSRLPATEKEALLEFLKTL